MASEKNAIMATLIKSFIGIVTLACGIVLAAIYKNSAEVPRIADRIEVIRESNKTEHEALQKAINGNITRIEYERDILDLRARIAKIEADILQLKRRRPNE